MKTCDICHRRGNQLHEHEPRIMECRIGTDVMIVDRGVTMALGVEVKRTPEPVPLHYIPVPVDLCSDCIRRVNDAVADHMKTEFNLDIRVPLSL